MRQIRIFLGFYPIKKKKQHVHQLAMETDFYFILFFSEDMLDARNWLMVDFYQVISQFSYTRQCFRSNTRILACLSELLFLLQVNKKERSKNHDFSVIV